MKRYRKASFDALPAIKAANGSAWYHEPRRNAWNRRARATTPGVPGVERTRERLRFLTDHVAWLKASHEWQRRKVVQLRESAARQQRQVRRAAPADRAMETYALKQLLTAGKAEEAELDRLRRAVERNKARLAREGAKLRQQKQRRAVTEELTVTPSRGAFPGGTEYRQALRRFDRLKM